MTLAFVYPGQGAQRPGMLSELPRTLAVRQTLGEASDLIPGGIAKLDSPAALTRTVPAQLALLISGVAATRALAEREVVPDVVAGHSVGAFAAAVAAGALDFGEAIEVVMHRARRMAELFPRGYGMLAVSGLAEHEVRAIASQTAAEGDPAWLACVNSTDQMVLTGTTSALRRSAGLAEVRGARRVSRIDVAVPSHAPILEPVSVELRSLLAGRRAPPLTTRYIGISTARPTTDCAEVFADLANGLCQTVRWRNTIGVIAELGARLVVQMPPGRALADLARADMECMGVDRVDVRALSDERLDDVVHRVSVAGGV